MVGIPKNGGIDLTQERIPWSKIINKSELIRATKKKEGKYCFPKKNCPG